MKTRQRHSYHEAGHAVAAIVLNLHVTYATASERDGRTLHQPARTDLETAALCWSGVVAESLAGATQSPASWLAQPDAKTLRELPSSISNRGLELAESIISEHEAAVRSVAEHLKVYRVLGGRKIRRIVGDPSLKPRRPRDAGVPVEQSFAK